MIDLGLLFKAICSGLGNGHANDRLTELFPLAVNRTLNDLAVNSDSISWPTITTTDGMLDFPFRYEYVLSSGVEFYLLRMGAGSASDPKLAAIQYKDTQDRWDIGKGDYVMDVDNQRQKDPKQNIIGWGSLYRVEEEDREHLE